MDSIRETLRVENLRSQPLEVARAFGGSISNKRKKRYQVFINADKKPKYLGSTSSLEEATKMRREAEVEYGYK